jgi:diaminopimelate decarboxylase/aspartate kinase
LSAPWVVLKFGGTSVSSVSNWHNIAQVLRDRIAEGLRPVVVHSALSGITDRLESLLTAAVAGTHGPGLERWASSRARCSRHFSRSSKA